MINSATTVAKIFMVNAVIVIVWGFETTLLRKKYRIVKNGVDATDLLCNWEHQGSYHGNVVFGICHVCTKRSRALRGGGVGGIALCSLIFLVLFVVVAILCVGDIISSNRKKGLQLYFFVVDLRKILEAPYRFLRFLTPRYVMVQEYSF